MYDFKTPAEIVRGVGIALFVYVAQAAQAWDAAVLNDPRTYATALISGAIVTVGTALLAAVTRPDTTNDPNFP